MTSNAMIDVVLGLILMYLVLALVCTSINEFIASLLSLRAKTLWAGLERMIDDKVLLSQFKDHGFIDGLRTTLKGGDPSYLSPEIFAAAILDSLDPVHPLPDLPAVRKAIDTLPPSNIKDMLLGAMTSSVKDLEEARANVAIWFDRTMERVSGILKRYMQCISFVVGLALAVGLNADTLTVAKALWSDDTLRMQIAAAAGDLLASKEAAVAPAPGATPNQPPESAESKALSQAEALGVQIQNARAQLSPLPIGWSGGTARPDYNWYATASGWIEKLIGWLVTAAAIMLGAPFWFDLLGKFMQLRSAGKKPEAAKSKDA
jgi:hypothetical protein